MKHNFLVIDLETSGLQGSEILEIYSVEMTKGGCTSNHFHEYVLPTRPVDPNAAKVNGYTEELWLERYAVSQERMVTYLNNMYEGKYLQILGWNPTFDISFILPIIKSFKISYHPIDVYSMIFPSLPTTDSKLANRKYIGLEEAHALLLPWKSREQAHTASGDVNMCIDLYRFVMEQL